MIKLMDIKFIIENSLVAIGGLLWVAASFSQLWKIIKTKNISGLSVVNQVLSAAGDLAWTIYFLNRGDVAPAVLCLILTIITTLIVFNLLAIKVFLKNGLLAIISVGLTTSIIYSTLPGLSGWLGVAYSLLAFSPWLIHMIKNRDLTGVSGQSIMFGYLAIVGTLVYGIMISSVQVATTGILGLLTQTVVLMFFLNSINKISFRSRYH